MAYKSNASPFYKGNQYLPKAGTKKEITPEQHLEVARCMEDPIYFAENYFKVVHQDADDGVIQMKLYPYQKEAVTEFVRTNRLLMATARQIGKTTIATVLILWVALFNKRKNIALVADKQDTATEVLDRIQIAYEYLPEFLKGGVKEWNKKSVTFENGSKIFASASGSNAIRGKSIFFLYIDEMAHIDDWDSFAASVLPTIGSSKKSKIVFTSTPNGMNHFHTYYQAAKKGIGDFPLVEVPWWKVEGRDEAWKLKTLSEMGFNQEKFEQEQEVQFLGSSGTLISGGTLKILETKIANPIHATENGLKVYQLPEKDHKYVLIADVSRGKLLDYHAFHVINVSSIPYKQVCVFHNNSINATDYATIINQVGLNYNNAEALIELNDNGGTVIDTLFMYHNYENLLMTQTNGVSGKMLSGFGGKQADRGIRTTHPVRSSGCTMLKLIIEQYQLQLFDKDTIDELKTFSARAQTYSSSVIRYDAEKGKHDDLVMGLVLFAWLVNQPYYKQLLDQDITQRLSEINYDDVEQYMAPFGVMCNGLDFEESDGTYDIPSDNLDNWLSSF